MKQEPHERLKLARLKRFAEATQAARALDLPTQTYLAHENGRRPFTRSAERYASFFRVSIDWLLTGRGPMKGGRPFIPVMGLVGAGAIVIPVEGDTAGSGTIGEVAIPEDDHLAALEIRGDSQWPRYLDGEVVVYDTRPVPPAQLLNRYAVVELSDGRRLLKKLTRSTALGRFRLESHNAPAEDDVEIEAAYAVRYALQS